MLKEGDSVIYSPTNPSRRTLTINKIYIVLKIYTPEEIGESSSCIKVLNDCGNIRIMHLHNFIKLPDLPEEIEDKIDSYYNSLHTY